jgi:hypothetical protein
MICPGITKLLQRSAKSAPAEELVVLTMMRLKKEDYL